MAAEAPIYRDETWVMGLQTKLDQQLPVDNTTGEQQSWREIEIDLLKRVLGKIVAEAAINM